MGERESLFADTRNMTPASVWAREGGDRMATDEPRCVPLCGASKAYGRFDQPWKHEPECPVRRAWEADRSFHVQSHDVTELVDFRPQPDGSLRIEPW